MSKTIKIVHTPVVAKIIDPTREVKAMVSEILSYKVQGSEYSRAASSWDGYSSFFNMRSCQFPTGFLRIVQKKMALAGYKVLAKGRDVPEPLGPEEPVVDLFGDDPRYDYQKETMRRLISMKRIVAMLATGSGKSRVFKFCAERINRPTLFVTTRKSLMYQMAKGYEETIKKPYGIIGDSQWNPYEKGVTFATVDTLATALRPLSLHAELDKEITKHVETVEKAVEASLKKFGLPTNFRTLPRGTAQFDAIKEKCDKVANRIRDSLTLDKAALAKQVQQRIDKHKKRREDVITFLSRIEFLCLEEAHEVSGTGYFDVCNACTNAHYRLGLSATPFMKNENQEANMRLMAATGSIGIRVTEKDLIDRGILATPYFKYVTPPKPQKLYRGTAWQRAYVIGIVESAGRNTLIIQEAVKAAKKRMPVMILVQQKKHGNILKKALQECGIKTEFIFGDSKQSEREQRLAQLQTGETQVLIGSTILDVGVDVPAVSLVILAGAGKAEVSLRQRIGRGLRAKKTGANACFVLDFNDRFNNHLFGHSQERRRIVEETPGFGERIVAEFDYSMF